MREPRDRMTTNWHEFTVGEMWAAVGDPVAPSVGDPGDGWGLLYTLLYAHRSRLQECRDLLTRSWRGPTARAFVAELDGLIDSINIASDAAAVNGPVLPHLVASVNEARTALEPVYQAWKADQARLAAAQQHPGQPTVVAGPDKQSAWHREATSVMTTLSSRLMEAYHAVQIPPDYKSPIDPDGANHPALPSGSAGPSGGGGLRRPPYVPGSSGYAPAQPGASTPGGDPGADGSALTGGVATAGQSCSGSSVPMVWTENGPEVANQGVTVIGPVPPTPWAESGRWTGPGGSGGGSGSMPEGQSQWIRRRGYVAPPGGVINGPPEGMVEPPLPKPRGLTPSPPGGIVGPTVGDETEGWFNPNAGGVPARRQDRRRSGREEYKSRDHWRVPEGVPPVIEPSGVEPVHDPGPYIGRPPEEPERRERWKYRDRDR